MSLPPRLIHIPGGSFTSTSVTGRVPSPGPVAFASITGLEGRIRGISWRDASILSGK